MRESVNFGLVLLLLIYLFALCGFGFFGSDRLVANFFHDDAFFYIKTAQNIQSGIGSSFDGKNLTNGYHPLWMAILVAISSIHPFYGFEGLKSLFVLHGILISGVCFVSWVFLRQIGVISSWRLVNVCLVMATIGFVDLGMETSVFVLLAVSTLAVASFLILNPQSKTYFLLISLLSALAILSRLDSILFLSILSCNLILIAFRQPELDRRSLATSFFILIPAVLTFSAVGLFNYVCYGHFETISGSLKSQWPGTLGSNWFAGAIPGLKVRMAGTFLVALALLPWLFFRAKDSRNPNAKVDMILLAPTFYCICQPIVLYFFMSGGVASWYFALNLLFVCLLSTYFLSNVIRKVSRKQFFEKVVQFGIVSLTMVFLYTYLSPRFSSTIRDEPLAAAKWLRDHVPQGQGIFQVDGSGFTGYFSERTVINGDGLINSWDYQDHLRTGSLRSYFKKMNMAYVVAGSKAKNGWVKVWVRPGWKGELLCTGSASLSLAQFESGDYSVYRVEDFIFAPMSSEPDSS